VELEIGKNRFRLGARDSMFIPRNVEHTWGGIPSKIINTYQPAGKIEEFFQGEPGLKLRASVSTEYLQEQASANVSNETMFLYLDDKAAELMPKMKASESLFVELVYPNEQKVTESRMAGLDAALAKMAEAGCHPPPPLQVGNSRGC